MKVKTYISTIIWCLIGTISLTLLLLLFVFSIFVGLIWHIIKEIVSFICHPIKYIKK